MKSVVSAILILVFINVAQAGKILPNPAPKDSTLLYVEQLRIIKADTARVDLGNGLQKITEIKITESDTIYAAKRVVKIGDVTVTLTRNDLASLSAFLRMNLSETESPVDQTITLKSLIVEAKK